MGWGQATSIVIRQRIDTLLNHSVSSSVTIARGPIGSGKSTAIRDWLARKDPEATRWSWVNLKHFDASLGSEVATISASLPELLDSQYSKSQNPVSHLVVFEGFGTAHEKLLTRHIQDIAVSYPNRRFIILTHELLELERRRGIVPIDISVIPPQEFFFTAEEAKTYFAGSVLEEFSEELVEDFSGSIVLLRLAKMHSEIIVPARFSGRTLTNGPENQRENNRSAKRAVHLALRNDVDSIKAAVRRDVLMYLESLNLAPALLDFYATLAVPRHIDIRMLPVIYSDAQPGWLSELEAHGLLHRVALNSEQDYWINPVHRQVLTDSFLGANPQRLRELNQSCAHFELEHGSAFQALSFALKAEDYTLATEVIRLHADEYLEGELGQRGANLLDGLPMTVLAKHPLLAISLAVAYSSTGKFKFKTLELLALAAGSAHTIARKAPAVDRLIMIMIESVAMRLSGFGDAAVRAARTGVKLYHEMSPQERDGIGKFEGSILVQLSLSLHSGLKHDEATEIVEFGVSADSRNKTAQNNDYAGTVLAYYYALDGDIRKAKAQLAESSPEIWSDPEANTYFATPFRLASCFCALEEQQFDVAEEWLSMLSNGQESNEFWPIIRLAEVMVAIVKGETTSSQVRMQGFLNREHEQPVAQKTGKHMLGVAACLLSLAAGDIGTAMRMTQKVTAGESRYLLQARIRLAQGDAGEALRLCAAAGIPISPRNRVERASVMLAAALQQKNSAAAGEMMRLVDALIKEFGLRMALNFLPAPDLERVLAQSQKMGVDLGLDRNLISPIPGGLGRVVLSERELAVMIELVSTAKTAEIAERQFVSVNTVKSQLKSVYKKLGVSERSAAIEAALAQGLIAPPENTEDDNSE